MEKVQIKEGRKKCAWAVRQITGAVRQEQEIGKQAGTGIAGQYRNKKDRRGQEGKEVSTWTGQGRDNEHRAVSRGKGKERKDRKAK